MTSDGFQSVTIPAGSTEPIAVSFGEPYPSPPSVMTAYSGSDELLNAQPVKHGNVTTGGFEVWSTVPLEDDIEVLWRVIL